MTYYMEIPSPMQAGHNVFPNIITVKSIIWMIIKIPASSEQGSWTSVLTELPKGTGYASLCSTAEPESDHSGMSVKAVSKGQH